MEHLRNTLKKAFKDAKNNPPEEGDPLKLVDVMVEMNQSDSITLCDMVSTFVGGFHTTGLCKWDIAFNFPIISKWHTGMCIINMGLPMSTINY